MTEKELQGHQLGLPEILGMAKRRLWWILIPVLLGPVAGYLISLKITPIFTSQAFVLVEQQKVPDTFVPSMVTDQLETRLATMQDQILSRSRLQPLIEQLGLYKDDLLRAPMDQLVARLRKAIKITPIRPDASNALRGFYVSVDADSPKTAQDICDRILTMFMEENLNARSKRAQDTTDFLAGQLNDAKRKLDDSDENLASFKSKYLGRLPTDEASNLQMLSTLSSRLDAVNEAIAQAQQQKVTQASMLAQERGANQGAKLRVERPSEVKKELAQARSDLEDLETRYTVQHPEIIKAKERIRMLEQRLDDARIAPPEAPVGASLPDSPEAVQLAASLSAIDETIKLKRAEQARLEQQIAGFQARIQLSPTVEEEFKGLTRDYEGSLQFYNDLLTKKTQAEMVRNLEQRREGEQFRVMDAPGLPSKPSSPDRTKFALAGLVLGFALGAALTALLELREQFVRTEKDIDVHLGLPVLGVIKILG
jgi:polysaccharide chain length determinant protein (PEP-CTERM system associated)